MATATELTEIEWYLNKLENLLGGLALECELYQVVALLCCTTYSHLYEAFEECIHKKNVCTLSLSVRLQIFLRKQ